MKYISDSEFTIEVLHSDVPVIVCFSASWCGPCKGLEPTLDQIEAERGSTVKMVKIDIDADRDWAQSAGVMGVPTMLFFHHGGLKARLTGGQTKSRIDDEINKMIIWS